MKYIIVDPIFRASRLYISMLNADIFKNNVSIVTQKKYKSDLLDQSYSLSGIKLFPIVNLPSDFWYDRLSRKHIDSVISQIEILIKDNQKYKIVFTGYNEFHPTILLFLYRLKRIAKYSTIYFMDYDSTYLLNEQGLSFLKKLKSMLKRYTVKLLINKNIHFILFDERIKDKNLRNDFFNTLKYNYNLHLICDPCPNFKIAFDSKCIEFEEDKNNILLVGTQVKRKGFDQVQALLDRELVDSTTLFHLKGRLTDENHISKSYKNLIIEEKFFSEDELMQFFYSTDYVILPYSKSFYASSGVLAYATTFGKPIISTEHGLIGYRVREFGLGYTYKYDDIDSLASIIKSLPKRNSEEYKKISIHCNKFAEGITQTSYKTMLRSIINEEGK